MPSPKTIPGSEFFKSLGNLEALAKGGTDKQEDEVNKAQLFHTPTDSEQQTWPGGEKKEIGNKWDDSIGADGTDYHPARKSIAEKALKGIPLSPEEICILKGDIEGCAKGNPPPFMKEEDEDEDDDDKKEMKKKVKKAVKAAMKALDGKNMTFKAKDDDDEKPAVEEKDKSCSVAKSFTAAVQKSESMQKGLELSEFLTDLVKAFGAGLESVEARTTDIVEQATNSMLSQIGTYLDTRFAEQATFNKSLADAVVNIGHGVAGNIEQLNQVAQAPVGPPKSQLRAGVKPIEKSFGGVQGEPMSKSQKLDVMVDLVEKGRLNSLEVCKFESTGQLRPEVETMIINHLQSGGKQ